jgi:hypothetical protein
MITAGASRVASGLLCLHAIAITPADPMELVRSSLSIVIGLPCVTVRSAPAIVVSGPAQRSLTLWPVRSRSRLATLSIESSDSFVCLHCRLDCYRVERTSSRAGVAPAEVQRLFTAHCYANYGLWNANLGCESLLPDCLFGNILCPERHTNMDGRSTHCLRFNANASVHQPNPLLHAREP